MDLNAPKLNSAGSVTTNSANSTNAQGLQTPATSYTSPNGSKKSARSSIRQYGFDDADLAEDEDEMRDDGDIHLVGMSPASQARHLAQLRQEHGHVHQTDQSRYEGDGFDHV